MHEQRIGISVTHQFAINLITGENQFAFFLLFFLAHGRPGISHNQIGTGDSFLRRSAELDAIRIRVHRSEEHTSELQSRENLVCRLLLDKNNWSVPST